jgi:hypothetical protein
VSSFEASIRVVMTSSWWFLNFFRL